MSISIRQNLSRPAALALFISAICAVSFAGVTVTSPAAGQTVGSPIHVVASAASSNPITAMRIYLDNNSVYTASASKIDQYVNASAGTHNLTVQAWDSTGAVFKQTESVTTSSSTSGGVTLTAPAGGTSGSSPVQVVASATGKSSAPITAMRIYVNNNSAYTVGSNQINASVTMPAGTDNVVVQAWDANGGVYQKAVTVNVSSGASTAPSSGPVGVSINPTSASVTPGQSKQFSASVSGTTNTGVVWLVNSTQGGSANTGTISSSGLYTAPPCVGTATTVTVAAKSAYDGSVIANASVGLSTGSSTSAGQYYVSTSGNDSSNGSACSPWATIAHADSSVGAGATVHVAPGTYPAITTSRSGTASARIKFVSDQKWGAKINANAYTAWTNSGNYVDIEGFDVTGNGCLGINNTGSFDRIIGNHVHNVASATSCGSNGGAGIDNSNYSGSDDDIIGNLVNDIGDFSQPNQSVQGIYHSNLRGHIYNNIVFHSQAWGICLWHAAYNVVIANNTVVNNGAGGLMIGDGDSPGGVTDDYTTVVNNIVASNQHSQYSNDGWGLQERGATGSHNVYSNNLVYGNAGGAVQLQNGLGAANTINSNPAFTNYTGDINGDYHLNSASPAIDKGMSTNAPSNDMDGGKRPMGNGYDIGSYEWSTTPGLWPWM